jgi:ABC-type transporter Mla maintaining outer membrane lipid asymmetry ATPase subunit MlaF
VAQESGVDYLMTGRENLTLQGRMYRMGGKAIQALIGELLELFGLAPEADQLVSSYSGGMRRKLDIATALIHSPQILFLDRHPPPGEHQDPRHPRFPQEQHLRRFHQLLLRSGTEGERPGGPENAFPGEGAAEGE